VNGFPRDVKVPIDTGGYVTSGCQLFTSFTHLVVLQVLLNILSFTEGETVVLSYQPLISLSGTMKIYIKYMVSLRCKMMVKAELKKLGLHYVIVDLGMVELLEDMTEEQRIQLKKNLQRSGLELLDDHQAILVEKIKGVITEMIHYSDEIPKVNYSEYISEKLNYDYTYLANTFSEVKGITIQQFIINNKIERVKELLLYDELNLTEIAYRMHYSSVAHLSNQFKKVTGLTPSFFKKVGKKRKSNLENL
jgi:AraC-like DNA-binding protein